jgi:hypothetical protein
LNFKEEYLNMKFDKTGPRFKLIQNILDKGCDHLMISDIIGEQQLLYILRRLQKDKQTFLKIKKAEFARCKLDRNGELYYVWLKVSKK